jgi:hypothetical protein
VKGPPEWAACCSDSVPWPELLGIAGEVATVLYAAARSKNVVPARAKCLMFRNCIR